MSTLLRFTKTFLSLLLTVFRYLFYRAITSFLTGIVLFAVAILMFVTFHQAYMPVVSHVKPVHLQFSSDCEDASAGLCSYPEANVFLTSQNEANNERMLMRGQSYKIFLDIEMPSSPKNEKLGMFMVNLKFLSAKGTVLKSSSRSCMLHYESNLVRLLRTIFYSLPLTLGVTEEKQKIEVNFFDDYIDDSYNPVVQAKVVIMTKHIEIYSSFLRLQASLTGLRYFVFNWPILFSCLAVFGNFITITLVYSACIKQLYPNPVSNDQQQAASQAGRSTTSSNSTSQQNGSIPGARAATTLGRPATTANHQPVRSSQNTTLQQRNKTSSHLTSNGTLPNTQNTTLQQVSPSCASEEPKKLPQKKRISLSQVKLTRKHLKIKDHKKVRIGIGNQYSTESFRNGGTRNWDNDVDCSSASPDGSDGYSSSTYNSDNRAKEGKTMKNKSKPNPDKSKSCKVESSGKKNAKKKMLLSGKNKKSNARSLSSPDLSPSGIEPVLERFSSTKNWEVRKLAQVRRFGRQVDAITRRVGLSISDLDLSTIEENRLHSNMPSNLPRKSSSTNDLTC